MHHINPTQRLAVSPPMSHRCALPFAQGLGLLALVLAVFSLAGCARQQKGGPKTMPTPEVEAAYPIEREVTDYEEFSGRTEAERTVELRALVSGYLAKAPGAGITDKSGKEVKEGADVEEGQLLFKIDPRNYQADLDRAEANAAQAEAHLRRLEADYRRAVNLRAQGAMPREEYDRIVGDRDEAQAALGSARAQEKTARLNLEYTDIKAPFAGRISRRNIDPGNLVQANMTMLTTILTLDPLKATFDADERTVLRIRRDVREGRIKVSPDRTVNVDLGLADEQTFPMKGKVDFVDNRVDPNTGTLRFRGVFPNPGKILTPGLFVRVRVPIGVPYKATLIPDSAVSSEQGTKYVYVLTEKVDAKANDAGKKTQQAKRRDVVLGPAQEGGLRVIKEGLKVGELVVVEGLQRVRDGLDVISTIVPGERKQPAPSGTGSSGTNPTIPKTNKPLGGDRATPADGKDGSDRTTPPSRGPRSQGRPAGRPK
jgi:RND family efflux transporter MFP subunit